MSYFLKEMRKRQNEENRVKKLDRVNSKVRAKIRDMVQDMNAMFTLSEDNIKIDRNSKQGFTIFKDNNEGNFDTYGFYMSRPLINFIFLEGKTGLIKFNGSINNLSSSFRHSLLAVKGTKIENYFDGQYDHGILIQNIDQHILSGLFYKIIVNLLDTYEKHKDEYDKNIEANMRRSAYYSFLNYGMVPSKLFGTYRARGRGRRTTY